MSQNLVLLRGFELVFNQTLTATKSRAKYAFFSSLGYIISKGAEKDILVKYLTQKRPKTGMETHLRMRMKELQVVHDHLKRTLSFG